ncbi:MAG: hypothetical protein OEU76_00785 [Cyclobacteriaceae bacterium]|nr:hypothetical protein [Cyclobacteriaceae bacterium]
MRQYLFIIIYLISFGLFGQSDREAADQYKIDQEQSRRAAVLRTMDSAIIDMNEGRYELADKKFQQVLNTIKGVPSDLTFYFGKNSFYLNRYKQSIDWINKYIQLKGTSGQFSAEATEILKKAEEGLLNERTKEAAKAAEVLAQDYDIDCGPSGKVICPVCKGITVIIKKGAFSNEYKTCPYCDKHGQLTCDEYNQLLRGELKQKQQ